MKFELLHSTVIMVKLSTTLTYLPVACQEFSTGFQSDLNS